MHIIYVYMLSWPNFEALTRSPTLPLLEQVNKYTPKPLPSLSSHTRILCTYPHHPRASSLPTTDSSCTPEPEIFFKFANPHEIVTIWLAPSLSPRISCPYSFSLPLPVLRRNPLCFPV